jgi:hypothetical protein
MLNNKVNTHGGSTSSAFAPQNMHLNRIYIIIATSGGVEWGTGTVTWVISPGFEFHIIFRSEISSFEQDNVIKHPNPCPSTQNKRIPVIFSRNAY